MDNLNNRDFDVVIIGGGINGAASAQHLSAAGYSVMLVEKADFASGTSSTSSRLLHCGIRYLVPGSSVFEFVRHPSRFLNGSRMARDAMRCRSQFVNESAERVKSFNLYYPVYQEDPFKPWQVDLAFKFLDWLGPRDVPLDYQRFPVSSVAKTPMLKWLRDQDKLTGVVRFREYVFDWPERIAMDTILDAERLGAEVCNYTAAVAIESLPDKRWRIELEDTRGDQERVSVQGSVLINMAGIWIDQVNQLSSKPVGRKITGTKGSHIVVKLPPECADFGIAAMHREKEPFYCIPWRGLHFFGPTETLFEGNIDDIRPSEEEILWLLEEANYLFPGMGLRRSDILHSWSVVRPLTYDPDQPRGARARILYDLADEGLSNAFTMTAGPIFTHRVAGHEVLQAVEGKIRPSGSPQSLSYAPRIFSGNKNSPSLLGDCDQIRLSDVQHVAQNEHCYTLMDILCRRLGVHWTESMAFDAAQEAAEVAGAELGWNQERVDKEVGDYREYLTRYFLGPF